MLRRRWLYILLAVLLVAGLAGAARILYPPVSVVVMTTGPAGSAYDVFARRYRELLAREGIDLRLEASAGSVENLRRLNDPRGDVGVGFVQGGLTDQQQSPELVSLGTMFYEPLWFYCRGDGCGKRPADLLGKQIAVGPDGSGTRALVERLLALNGLGGDGVKKLPLDAADAADALLRGDIDAAAMVAPWSTSTIRKLTAATDIELLDFPRADAYVALDPYLTKLVVPTGVGNIAANRPPTDVRLLAVKASLIVRKELDAALASVLLDAATQIHSGADIFQRASQFPAPEAGDLPVSADALQYYKSGRPFLQRYLPFRLAQLAGRLLVVLVPLLGVVYPLIRFVPTIYGWSMRRRVFHLYGELKLIEIDLEAHRSDPSVLLRRLDALEERADHVHVPLGFAQILYTLRSHIVLTRSRLQSQSGRSSPRPTG
jgi:TRAP transporter TAXI family solute receptor